jgi:hypothetical protein
LKRGAKTIKEYRMWQFLGVIYQVSAQPLTAGAASLIEEETE